MMHRTLLAMALLALAAPALAAPSRKSERNASAGPAATSWSKKTALAPLPDSALVPFVTSRVERVPKPEEGARRRPSKSRAPAVTSADNSIDHEGDAPKPAPKGSKGSKQASRRRWGPEAYNLFADTEARSQVLRKVPAKYIRKLPYQRTPHSAFEATGSVTSSTLSVSPIRYKIIDMGDPWVAWSQAHGFNPHESQVSNPHHQQALVRPNRQEAVASGPLGMYGPDYGGGGSYGGEGFQRSPLYSGQTGAYSGLHDSVIDPFRREQYGPRDAVPWSVQVGTRLTVNDDGRRSRRQFYVRSEGGLLG